jgi:hypothetical protein
MMHRSMNIKFKNRWELWGFQCGNVSVAMNYVNV